MIRGCRGAIIRALRTKRRSWIRGSVLNEQERRRQKMYYRVAIQVDAAPPWKWQSTALSLLGSLLQWLQVYRAFPHERLRIFSSSSREALNEQLEQENQGLASTSVTAVRFLRERRLCPPAGSRVPRSIVGNSLEREEGTERKRESIVVISQPAVNERGGEGSALGSRGMRVLERRREELESGPGGDHDIPYRFSLPISLPQVLAWMTLLARVQQGEL